MRAINSAQLTYALTCGAGFYAPSLTRLGTNPPNSTVSFIGGGLGIGDVVTKSSYVIQLTATPFPGAPASCNGAAAGDDGQGFKAAADPNVTQNVRYLATNANNMIFEHSTSLWAVMPEFGEPPVGHVLR